MALINFQQKEIVVKIVYYGPAFSGKTTNVRKLHDLIPSKLVGSLATLDTDDERTLFFDYFPIKAGAIGRYKLKLQIYSVPGQAYYRSTRKMVLQNADGVVFVADSQASEIEHNIVAFSDLEENLRAYGVDMESFPIVIQYNKRDLKNILPTDFLDRKLNLRGYPYCEGSAVEGKGVLEAFNGIVELVTRRLRSELSRTESGQPLDGTFFQPQGGEQEESAVSELVHQIADLGEHGEVDLREALSAVGESPGEDPSGAAELLAAGEPLHLELSGLDKLDGNGVHVHLKGTHDQQVHVSLPRDFLDRIIKPSITPPTAPQLPSRPDKMDYVVFFWLMIITVLLILFWQ